MPDLGLTAYEVALNGPPPPQPLRPLPPSISLPYLLHCCGTAGAVSTPFGSLHYGSELLVTENMLGHEGNAVIDLLELLADPGRQRQLFGEIRLRPGPWPSEHPRYLPGSKQWKLARDNAYAQADALDYDERSEALKMLNEKYGQRFGYNPSNVPPAYGDPHFSEEDAE